MFEGQILLTDGSVYGPWMRRGGDFMIYVAQLIAASNDAELTVSLYTKNHEDTGNGSFVTSSDITLTSPSTAPTTVGIGPGALKELVRYQFSVAGASASDWALFRMMPPIWFDGVTA